MKHVVNILLLGMVLLGIAMMADTPWGLGVALAPFGVWGARFLFLVHKSLWAAVIFWGGSLTSSGKLLWLSGLCLD